jgi:diguanylate cyclase (GGDEF)-like protein
LARAAISLKIDICVATNPEHLNCCQQVLRMRGPIFVGFPFLLAMVLVPCCAGAAPPALTTVAAVRALTSAQAAESRPVDLKGIVTFYDHAQQVFFFQDSTGSIYVHTEHDYPVAAGSRVEIHGTTGPGYTTEIDPTEIRETSRGPLPKPIFVSYAEAARHENDCRFVTMEGIVRSSTLQTVGQSRVYLLDFEVDHRMMEIAISNDPHFDPVQLLDATVRATGNLSGDFNARDQIVGLQLTVSDAGQVVVLKPAARNFSEIPVIPLGILVRSDSMMLPPERIRTQGVLTLYDPGERMVIKDGDDTLPIQTRQMDPMTIGQRVEVTGFPAAINGSPALEMAQAVAAGGVTPLSARDISFADAMSGKFSNDLVALEGEVVSETREHHLDTLTVRSGNRIFQALYRKSLEDMDPIPWYEPGTKIRVEGVCIVHTRGFWGSVESFQMHLRSERDIRVLALPSWWTVRHMLFLTSGLLGAVLLIFGWGIWMRRRLGIQEALLRQKVELEAARLDNMARLERQRSHILELINSFEPLNRVFDAIHRYAAELWPGVHVYAHVLHNRKLTLVAGSGLNDEEIARLQVIDPSHSSEPCAVAVRTRSLASHTQPLPVWSRAMISSQGEILGAMTFECAADSPVRFNQNAFDFGCNLAAVAIDNRRLYESALHRSEHDQLTGLPNRVLLDARLDEALRRAHETQGLVAILFLDLDGFKAVNDNHSHRIGDLYLCEVAHRFQSCLRESDALGRVGGDEFIVVIADMLDPALASEVAARLLQAMKAPFVVEDITIQGSVSIGVAVFQDVGDTAGELKHQADAAMYAAKRAGGGQISFSEPLPLTR